MGPLYFLTPRKCQLFGVCSEANAEQVNYLIDENDFAGKGANCVVSLLHHYLEWKTSVGQHLLLHADNATGQNKNNTVIHYLMWRVLTGRNPTIKISFMISGHTKFAPDRFFGLIKRSYQRTSVSTLLDIEQVVHNSSTGGHNIPQSTVDCRTGERYVVWYSWGEHFNRIFRSLPSILKYHHIRFDTSALGICFAKEYANTEEVTYRLVLDGELPDMHQMPAHITPPGMSSERQRYLYEKIRPFCSSEQAAELTCPMPTSLVVEHAASKGSRKSTRLCSHCRKPGHTKTVRGKISCPELLRPN